jgi:hypothetical protein
VYPTDDEGPELMATRRSHNSNEESLYDYVDDDCFEDISGEPEERDNSSSDASEQDGDGDDDYGYTDSVDGGSVGDEGWGDGLG